MDPDLVPDPDPDIFVINLQDANEKLIKKTKKTMFFCLLLFEGTFTSFIHSFTFPSFSKRSHKTVGIKVFLLFLLDDRRIRIRTSD
jgi:hypothetical protein